MPSPQVSAVVFDIGGVLLDWDPRHLYRQLIADPQELADFLDRICTRDWHRAHDLGADITESCRQLARQHPGQAELIMAWAERGEEMIAGQIDGTVEVLAELRADGTPCFALSNMEPAAFEVRRARFPFLTWFDGCVISGYEGVAKPDREIFEILLRRHDLDPARTVFVDDLQHNVAAAAGLGITGVQFAGPAGLRRDLRALGLPL
ncbi:MAG TPA: HAD family phosphatase [Streptosporangiaceae bacterium]|jgi:2-haloacid dehalogenase